jgi:hypothetical protein
LDCFAFVLQLIESQCRFQIIVIKKKAAQKQ